MSYYTDQAVDKKSGGGKKSSSKRTTGSASGSGTSSTLPPGAVKGRVVYPPGYDPDVWLSRREQDRAHSASGSSSSSESSSSSSSSDEEEHYHQMLVEEPKKTKKKKTQKQQPLEPQPQPPKQREREKSQPSVPARRKTDGGSGGGNPWSIENQCSNLVKRLSLAKGFGPSSTPASDEDRWHTTTIPANRSAFVQAVSVTAMAQAELAAREAWEKFKPRSNADLDQLVEELEIKITVNPGKNLWAVASAIAVAIRDGAPITHELLETCRHSCCSSAPFASSKATRTSSKRQDCGRRRSTRHGEDEEHSRGGSPRSSSSRRK
nr:MAG: tegument protein VP22 [Turdid alphaherpesvirus 1]